MTSDEKIRNAAAALESLANTTGANVLDILGVLRGWAWDDEDAGRIREYLEAGPAPDRRDEQIAMLREALEWYRDRATGCRKLGRIGDDDRQALDRDGGKRAEHALAATAQPEPTLEEMIDSGLVDPGLVAAWEASEYTEYGDEGELPELIRESYRSATAQPEQDGGWLPMESAPRDGSSVLLLYGEIVVQAHFGSDDDGDYNNPSWIPDHAGALWHGKIKGWRPLPAPPTRTEAEGD